jgi:hypothetical protein
MAVTPLFLPPILIRQWRRTSHPAWAHQAAEMGIRVGAIVNGQSHAKHASLRT